MFHHILSNWMNHFSKKYLMFIKPPICFLWRSIHSTFYITIIRRFISTRSITSPPPFSTWFYFIMKCMINCNRCFPYSSFNSSFKYTLLINPFHMFLKFITMIIMIEVIICNKEISMYHFMLFIILFSYSLY